MLLLLAQAFSLANPRLPDSPLIYVSEGFTTLTGYSKEEAVGQSARFLQGSIQRKGSDIETFKRMSIACQTMTDTNFRILNQRKDGSIFLNQSSLFHVFASESSCSAERHNSALLMCVHQDATGLTEEQCLERNKHAEELKTIIQGCLSTSHRSDTRSLADIRSSEVRPPAVSVIDHILAKSSSSWLLKRFQKKSAMLAAQETVSVPMRSRDAISDSFAKRNLRALEAMASVEEDDDGEQEDESSDEEDTPEPEPEA